MQLKLLLAIFNMKLSEFTYELPQNQIAQYPAKNREDARMLVVHRRTGEMEVRRITDLLDYFTEKDCIVVNNAKVMPAMLKGCKEKTRDSIEVFLQRELVREHYLWDSIVEPARKIRSGNKLFFGKHDELVAEVVDNTNSRGRTIKFFWEGNYESFRAKIHELGSLYLPSYIKRKPDRSDNERYNSIFAHREGAVITCGASLHFSERLVQYLEIEGVNFAQITLYNSLAGNRTIEVEDLAKAKVESDYFEIEARDARIINRSLDLDKKVCAVGIMSLRTLESSYNANLRVIPQSDWTHINIHPPYTPQIANALLVNFHPPQTYPFVTACAFGGVDLVKAAYERAIKEKFRFFIYGDSMLIL